MSVAIIEGYFISSLTNLEIIMSLTFSFMSDQPLNVRLDAYIESFSEIRLEQYESLCNSPSKITGANRINLEYFLDISQNLIDAIDKTKSINLEISNPLLPKAIRNAQTTLDRAKVMIEKRRKNPVDVPAVSASFLSPQLHISVDTAASVTPQHSPTQREKPLHVRLDEYTEAYFDFRLSLFETLCDDPSQITGGNRTELRVFLNSSQALIEDIEKFRITIGFEHALAMKVRKGQPILDRAKEMLAKLSTNRDLEQKLSKTPTPASTPVGTPVFVPQFQLSLNTTRNRSLTPPQYSPTFQSNVTPPQPSSESSDPDSARDGLFRLDM